MYIQSIFVYKKFCDYILTPAESMISARINGENTEKIQASFFLIKRRTCDTNYFWHLGYTVYLKRQNFGVKHVKKNFFSSFIFIKQMVLYYVSIRLINQLQ